MTAAPIATPWAAGRFDAAPGAAHLLFGRTFEDPDIEAELFPPSGRVLCIASAGDTARALAAPGRSVLAVDINPRQLEEVRRRLDGQPPRAGRADHLLAVGRTALVPFGWRPAALRRFCELDDPAEQVRAWRDLTPPSVRTALRLGLSPRSLATVFGQPFARLVPRDFGVGLLDRVGVRLGRLPNRENPWLRQLLTGAWTRPEPPAGGPIDLCLGDVAAVLEEQPAGSRDGISLSNVLDGPGAAYRRRVIRAADRAARPGAPIIVRSFLDAADPDADGRAARDRSLLWGSITLLEAGAPPS